MSIKDGRKYRKVELNEIKKQQRQQLEDSKDNIKKEVVKFIKDHEASGRQWKKEKCGGLWVPKVA